MRKEESEKADRIIVITDEQDCDLVNKPASAHPFGRTNYLINVASFKNGIGDGEWTTSTAGAKRWWITSSKWKPPRVSRASDLASRPSTDAKNFGEQPHEGHSPKLLTRLCVIQQPAAWCGTATPPQCRPRWERRGRATTA